ncbi:MAG TPA: glycosyltransferase [Candidatus Acidoferrales bacterium]|nr:glycosyltransferase [Candidatus Acidoferrales bacterium]
MPAYAPVVLFVYNRPEHTARTLASLAANVLADQSELIIYADGPKNPEHEGAVRAAREVARQARGFKSVRMIERDRNLGLANSVITGITETCETYGRAIVVEDDLLLSPDFLAFMNAGLARFIDEDRVYQVSGYMFPGVCKGSRARFLPLTTTWGWGTWQRAWRHLDQNLSELPALRANAGLRRRFDLNGSYDYFEMACRQKSGQIDSWGIAWYLTVFLRGGFILYPARSLVVNVGIEGSGTHGRGSPALQGKITELNWDVAADLIPDDLAIDNECLASVEALLRSKKSTFLGRMKAWFVQ